MKKSETIQKNLDLHAEWMRYIFNHPEALDKIPPGAEIIIVPGNEPELAAENLKKIRQLKVNDMPFVIVHLDLPKPPMPEIEIFAAHR